MDKSKIIDRSYKRNRKHRYNIGNIIETRNGKIIIIGLTRILENNKNIKAYNCKCLIDNHEFIHTENYIDNKRSCPVCSNSVVIKGINDISTTHPHLVKYFSDINDAYNHTYGSNKKALIKCPDCGFEKNVKVCRLFTNNYSCSRCSDGVSYPNKFMLSILSQLNVNFINEFNPNWANDKKYDFYFELNDKKYIIEMDGEFHFKEHSLSNLTIQDIREIDKEKDLMALKNGIKMIRIDCYYKSTDDRYIYIQENIKNSLIGMLFNLNNINWDICNEYATNSLV